MKRSIAVLLVLVLSLGLSVPALAAGKLADPSDLQWGVRRWHEGQSELVPGTMSWKNNETADRVMLIKLYQGSSSTPAAQMQWEIFESEYNSPYDCISAAEMLAHQGKALTSGTYYFTVQNTVNWDSSSRNDSAVVTSPRWTYSAPSAKLATPATPVWNSFPYFTWDLKESSSKVSDALLMIYFSKTKNGTYTLVGSTVFSLSGSSTSGKDVIGSWCLDRNGAGYYKLKTIALSSDVDKWQSSDWSAFSEPYYYDGKPLDICYHDHYNWGEYIAPTCTEDGYTGDRVCADCGEVLEKGEVISAQGHHLSYDGVCWICDEKIEYHTAWAEAGTSTTYSTETGMLSLNSAVPSGQTVYAATFDSNGHFTGVKALTGSDPQAAVGTGFAELKLFWLKNGSNEPQYKKSGFSIADET